MCVYGSDSSLSLNEICCVISINCVNLRYLILFFYGLSAYLMMLLHDLHLELNTS